MPRDFPPIVLFKNSTLLSFCFTCGCVDVFLFVSFLGCSFLSHPLPSHTHTLSWLIPSEQKLKNEVVVLVAEDCRTNYTVSCSFLNSLWRLTVHFLSCKSTAYRSSCLLVAGRRMQETSGFRSYRRKLIAEFKCKRRWQENIIFSFTIKSKQVLF